MAVMTFMDDPQWMTKNSNSYSNLEDFQSFDEGLGLKLGQADKFTSGPECRRHRHVKGVDVVQRQHAEGDGLVVV